MSLSERQLQVIQTLADGAWHSGEALGRLLGVSRAAVWKQLQSLAELGLDVRSHKGRGYCLAQPLSLLDAETICAAMIPRARALTQSIRCFASIDSTNAWLLREAAAAPVGGLVVLAEQQSAGRGRRGRTWISPFGCNLYGSVGWQFDQGAAALEGLSLAVGVCVVEALQTLGVNGLALKWPNDILLDGRKLGGILLEIGGDLSGQCYLVLGLGLNLAMSSTQAAAVDQPWASLDEQLAGVARNQVAARVLDYVLPLLADFSHTGFAPYKQRWEILNAYRNRVIQLQRDGELQEGVCRDLGPSGALAVEMAQGIVYLQGGEISLRVTA